jgi:hypothetical protein
MIELVGDRAGHVLERDEINDVVVFVEIIFDLDRRAVVVAMQPLTAITFVSDEMPRAEHQVILGNPDLEARARHGLLTPGVASGISTDRPACGAGGTWQLNCAIPQGHEQGGRHEVGGGARVELVSPRSSQAPSRVEQPDSSLMSSGKSRCMTVLFQLSVPILLTGHFPLLGEFSHADVLDGTLVQLVGRPIVSCSVATTSSALTTQQWEMQANTDAFARFEATYPRSLI